MGFAISWLAVRDGSADDCCAALGLRRTGRESDEPEIGGVRLKSGWYLVWFESFPGVQGRTEFIQAISKSADVLTCMVEEHVMFSYASLWRDGQEVWHVAHQGDEAVDNLSVAGDPPPELDGIRREIEQRQAEEDESAAEVDHMFDIPLELARKLTGFKHDEAEDGEFPVYEELEPESAGRIRTGW